MKVYEQNGIIYSPIRRIDSRIVLRVSEKDFINYLSVIDFKIDVIYYFDLNFKFLDEIDFSYFIRNILKWRKTASVLGGILYINGILDIYVYKYEESFIDMISEHYMIFSSKKEYLNHVCL